MDEKEIKALAHRMAWRYSKSQDRHQSDTYTFNRYCLLQFAGKLLANAREAHAEAPKDWEEAYAELRDGDAFPPGTQALKVAFVAGMQWQARAALAAAPAPAPLTDGHIDQAISELGLDYLANAAENRAILRKLCHCAHGIGTDAARAQAQKG